MPLDPDLEAFLELVEAGIASGAPRLHEMPITEARRQYDASTLALESAALAVPSVRPIRIPCRDGNEIDARLYAPDVPGATSRLPALLYFHGGGYCVGSLDSHDSLCRTIAALTPCCVLSVAYRLAPEHPFPTAVHDSQDAYAWLLANGTSLGIDTKRLAVGGDSAGGTLATVITITARNAILPQPILQVLLYPCTSRLQDTGSHRRLAEGHLLEASTLQWMFDNYLAHVADRHDWRFAPLEAADLSGLAPAFVVLAEYDPLVDEGIAYAERLQTAGVQTNLRIYPGMTHDFARLGNVVAEGIQVREDIARALAIAFQAN